MADDAIPLSPSHMLGIVQRSIWELDIYLRQPWYRIDKRRALAFLGEAAQWVDRLEPLPEQPQPPPLPAAQPQKR